jgi:uncharacterized protein
MKTNYALITGGNKGIGFCIANELAKRGNNIILTARNESLLRQACNDLSSKYGIKAIYISADLTQDKAPEQILDFVKQQGLSVDMLINNAGFGLSGAFENSSLIEITDMMKVNMEALVKLTYLFLPELKKQQKAYVLNIASTASYQAVPFLSVYAATKSFVLSFSRALDVELRNSSVSVTCVSPGATETEWSKRAGIKDQTQKVFQKIYTSPEKVASMAVRGMFNRKPEVITGLRHQFGTFFSWLLPKRLVESVIAGFFKK